MVINHSLFRNNGWNENKCYFRSNHLQQLQKKMEKLFALTLSSTDPEPSIKNRTKKATFFFKCLIGCYTEENYCIRRVM